MNGKRTFIAAIRKVVFAGIILLAVWLILFTLKGVIPQYFISELNIRTNYPDRITVGADSCLWFTETNTNQIGKFSPLNGKITEYNIPLSGRTNTNPQGITPGPDDNLWFVEGTGNKIDKLSPTSGKITEYNVPTVNADPANIVTGPDGNLWFTELEGNKLGKISPSTGLITEYYLPAAGAGPVGITAGPDGNLWFTEQNGNKLGKISPENGSITEYTVPTANSYPIDITAGPDGNLWFVEQIGKKLGKISPIDNTITEYQLPPEDINTNAIANGHDGNLWFVSQNTIGKISPVTGSITRYNFPDTNTSASDITAGPGGNLWFTEYQGNIGKISPETGSITEYSIPLSNKPNTWDWTKSLYSGESVSKIIGQNLGVTLGMIALIGLMSLFIAGVLLSIGVFTGNIIKRPGWLLKVRGILRLVLVSGGASIPVFVISTFIAIFISKQESPPQHQISFFWSAFACSLMPAWLLVQSGYGMLSNQTENTISLHLAKQLGIRLFISVLKLTGLIIVITTMASWFLVQPGLDSLLINHLYNRDFPVFFGIIWVMVIIVVPVKLAAELIEIYYNYLTGQTALIAQVPEKPIVKKGIPMGWLIFSLGLCTFIILAAVFGPLLAPNGDQINILNRLQPPSAKYLMGTDQIGRDVLSCLLFSIRTDVLIGLAVAAVVSLIAGGWAILAAHYRRMNNRVGNALGDIVMLPGDIICAFPWLALLLLPMSMALNRSTIFVALIVGLVILPRAAGMIQETCRSPLNRRTWRQNVLRSISVVFIFTTAGVIFYVSTLGYMGFGSGPGFRELGYLASSGSANMQQAPWLTIWPLIILSLILITLVMTGYVLSERLGFGSKSIWLKIME